jgi:hypothetical protein
MPKTADPKGDARREQHPITTKVWPAATPKTATATVNAEPAPRAATAQHIADGELACYRKRSAHHARSATTPCSWASRSTSTTAHRL